MSLEYMKQQGIIESEADRLEREQQENKLKEEKDRAKKEILRLEQEK